MTEVALGFVIALAIGLTGVGAGSITAPVLLLLLGTPAPTAVGTALIFGGVIKLIAAPSYLWRKQVNFRVLGWMVAGGLPGVLLGSVLFARYANVKSGVLLGVLGVMIALTSAANLWRLFRSDRPEPSTDRRRWLPLIALPIGAEFGFSSAGAGALGSVALMGLTTMPARQIVGTDVFFGLALSLIGGGFQFSTGNYDAALLTKLIIGGLFGVLVGANLSALMPSRPLRFALSVWLMSLGGQLCWRSFS
jgi:uncharacterized membrane protein YfcA